MKAVWCGLAVFTLTLTPGLTGPAQGEYDFTSFGVPRARPTYAFGMNDGGQVVGSYNFGGSSPSHAFLLSDGQYTTIDVPGAPWTDAFAINNAGQIVGGYYDSGDKRHGFLLSDGEYTTIDVPGASS